MDLNFPEYVEEFCLSGKQHALHTTPNKDLAFHSETSVFLQRLKCVDACIQLHHSDMVYKHN